MKTVPGRCLSPRSASIDYNRMPCGPGRREGGEFRIEPLPRIARSQHLANAVLDHGLDDLAAVGRPAGERLGKVRGLFVPSVAGKARVPASRRPREATGPHS
jgi:hypothetical protein